MASRRRRRRLSADEQKSIQLQARSSTIKLATSFTEVPLYDVPSSLGHDLDTRRHIKRLSFDNMTHTESVRHMAASDPDAVVDAFTEALSEHTASSYNTQPLAELSRPALLRCASPWGGVGGVSVGGRMGWVLRTPRVCVVVQGVLFPETL